MATAQPAVSHVTTNGHASSHDHPYHSLSPPNKPTILHLGGPIIHNVDLHARFRSQFHDIRPSPADLHRGAFVQHLRDRTWGNFSAIMKPFWATGGDMGRWDEELISLLPSSMRVMASAGAGFDWVNTALMAERGEHIEYLGVEIESDLLIGRHHIL